jgi:hypothetical protein
MRVRLLNAHDDGHETHRQTRSAYGFGSIRQYIGSTAYASGRKNEDEAIEELFNRDATYDSYEADVDCALFLSSWADGYSYNCYALGLLLATGFKSLKVPPGYNKPLDAS